MENVLINKSQCTFKCRYQFIIRLKDIKIAMGFSLLLFFQPLLLTSDLLTDQEVTRSKKMTLSIDNDLTDLIGLSPIGLRVVAFEEVKGIYRLYRNEVVLEMARINCLPFKMQASTSVWIGIA